MFDLMLPRIFRLFFIMLACCTMAGASANDATPGYQIGVYYFPGWRDGQRGAPAVKPWERIKAYPEREPLLGWYQEGDVEIAEKQIAWMKEYGIDYVVFNWFWDGKPFLEHGLSAFMQASNRDQIRFSLLWANHSKVPKNIGQFTSMVDYWIKYYFPRDEFLKIDGRPVVFIFSQQQLRDNAKSFGTTTAELIALADAAAIRAGFSGIFFVGGTGATNYWVKEYGPQNNYSAFSAYNYDRGFSGTYNALKRPSHSYMELDQAYRENWDWILANSPLPYILPVTSGWDKRPWGGSRDPFHDNSSSSPDEFEQHLKAAKLRIDNYPDKTKRMSVICCWNEYGEGSYIEPTKKQGFSYLEKIQKVFGDGVGQ